MKPLNPLRCCRKLLTCFNEQFRRKSSTDWNRIVSDAERVVGYPTSFLRNVLSDEISNLVQKLVVTEDQLLKIKRLIDDGKKSLHNRGLVVLLLSKAAGQKSEENTNDPIRHGISHRQRILAEITEMCHMASQIHKGVVNISRVFPDENVCQDVEFGNKIAVMCGDYLYANVFKSLGLLRHPDVAVMITEVMTDSMQAEYKDEVEVDGNVVDWEEKNYWLKAAVLAMSCRAALVLADQDEKLQNEAFEFGKNIALAWQVHSELQPFTNTQKHLRGTPFDLTSLPVLIHLKDDPQLLDYIKQNLANVDFKFMREAVLRGTGIDQTKQLCRNYVKKSIECLNSFSTSDANLTLRKMLDFL